MTLPTPEQIKAARLAAGLSTEQAASIACVGQRAWQLWEEGKRTINAASWTLFQRHINEPELVDGDK